MLHPVRSFIYGFKLPLQAARLILATPRLLSLAAIPIVLSGVLYYYGFRTLQDGIETSLLQWMGAHGFGETHLIASIAKVTIQVVLFLLGAILFSTVSTIIASPFNDWLAESTERFSTPSLAPVSNPGMRAQLRLMFIDISKSVACAIATLLAIVLSWVPVLNLISLTCACLLMTFQYISYPQTRRSESLLRGAAFLFRHFFSCLGLGVSLTLGFSIPFLGGFTLPIAVVAGTLLYARKNHPTREISA